GGNIVSLEAALLSRNARLSSSLTTGQFLGSHDEDGFLATTAGGDLGKLRVAAALQLTAKGIPVIYYGEEINLSGPDGYGKEGNNRYDMQFENLTAEQQKTLTHYQKLLAARNKYLDVFAAGDRSKVAGSDADGYVVFKRSYQNDSVWVGLNTTSQAKQVTFTADGITKAAELDAVYGGADVTVAGNKVTVTIPAKEDGGTVILAKQEAQETPDTPQQPQPTTVEATGVTLSQTEATVERGKDITLTATVVPTAATDKKVTFTSSNEKVATVDDTGKVTAVEKGTATITAKTANGKTATCAITVIVPATKVYVDQSFTIKKGQSKTLTATLVPSDTTDKVTWTSSNTKKVTVDAKGKIKAVAAGTAKITATTDSGKKAVCTVTVVAKAKKATKVTIGKTSKTMKVGEVKQLKVTVKPAKTTDAVTYKSSKKNVVAVAKNGVLTAKKPGTATITVKAGKKKATIKITVNEPATAVTLNKTTATIKKGKTLKLKATLTPKNSNDTLTYTSSKKSVATVNKKGVVTGKKKGTATITVKTSSGKKATCKVTVK
ncbi:MAG: Ig-like domain-containing protein, partial [Lachnospiraceae bacterium]|nr:Ig-like domain-containing protein [Lachnospiraceae bacterium]